ncbi:MAG: helix-turn-helix domain-containing protein [Azoarcus sp.]|nr:helix-turn-helix domain-containing protein [Azoarcus sp.]
MLIAHEIALDLNDRQATYMARVSGCARFAYNWALE